MPLTEKQQEYLMHCNHRWNVKVGATGSGKSFVDFAATIPKRILAAKGEGLLVLIGNTRGTLERNILEPMRDIWPGNVGIIRGDNTIDMFGRKVYALGADSKKHVARIQGATIEYAYGDEVTTWSEAVFQMLKSRLRCDHSHFDGTCNPDNPQHWFKRFLDTADTDIFQQSYVIDDGVLPERVVSELKKEYAGTVYYGRYILGQWTQAEGLIYPMYADALETPYDAPFSEYALSIDYGTQNAFAALLWGREGDTWHAFAEYRYSGRDERRPKTDDDYVRDMERFVTERVPEASQAGLLTIIDPSAASFIAAIMRSHLRFKVRKADNDVLDGIRDTAVCMQRGAIRIFDTCMEMRKELDGYVWDSKAADTPVKVNDHLADACRYFVRTKRLVKPRSNYVSPLERR